MARAREIELLSPARDAECAIAAISAGADAVYMGGPAFGARAQACNTTAELERAAAFAHRYGARLYLALNTILDDAELEAAARAARDAYEAGADAMIIQDMGLLKCPLPPIALHASTQCDIRTPEKARFLESLGFDTLVLARELPLEAIAEISGAVKCRIECFVHGALCVSRSGACYLSFAAGGRSGNRGECAQPCRMKYSLSDADGRRVAPPAHYLSLRDMNRSGSLGEMIAAGVASFKIEGRLKDADYVKNITAFYRRKLDAEIARAGLARPSLGESEPPFAPNPEKTFNRGFTEYFLHSHSSGNASFDTPKSRGEFVGTVSRPLPGGFEMSAPALSNGDGILVENPDGTSFGTLVQTAMSRIVKCPRASGRALPGAKVWRNKSVAFSAEISRDIVRRIPVNAEFSESGGAYAAEFSIPGTEFSARAEIPAGSAEAAQDFDAARARIISSLAKLGGTEFKCASAKFSAKTAPFLRAAALNALRRECVEALRAAIIRRGEALRTSAKKRPPTAPHPGPAPFDTDYRANVLNSKAEELYRECGFPVSERAMESGLSPEGRELMRTRHCILKELGLCKKLGRFPAGLREPLALSAPGLELSLAFTCSDCGMSVRLAPKGGGRNCARIPQ